MEDRMTEHKHYAPQPPMITGIRGLCPRCGQGHLFSFADPADGPAFFSLTIVSFPILGLIWWFDATYEPAFWVHLLTSLPFLLVACVLPLRPLKGWLVCAQYFHKAEEGRLAVKDLP
jgi:uncharacterized protein (DUF983 family)